ncbi:uncharacterized protein OCT59_015803 [Rhizophagus irregularis]|uniref:uncharacterized protein n=1 Tax=Rhizophagus irregularis TaxID=588596 RepID=UPI0033195615|nr:hypothetical protein OCT59_015803 [Rhizophagus irregularis]
MDRELPLDHTQEEIEENLNKLKSKLEHPTTKADINLYGSLKQSLAGIESLDLIWRDPKASMVLSDNSDIVKNLGIVAKCINFVKVFNNTKNARSMKNILHNKKWKESETDLVIITERILGIIRADGKKPDIMGLLEQDEKIIELLYTESSRIVCSNSKKSDDEVKLWRETLDEASYISALCRPTGNQFGIKGESCNGGITYVSEYSSK